MRTRECTASVRRGRLRKAEEFLAAASVLGDGGETASTDPQVSLYVLAGIAAADVICCAGLGEHSVGRTTGRPSPAAERAATQLVERARLLSAGQATAAP